jgi:hypothetical protein
MGLARLDLFSLYFPRHSLGLDLVMAWLSILLVPGSGYLWRRGGKENKDWRRYGIPVLHTVALFIFEGFSIWWPVLAVLWHFAFRAPFTLVGDDIRDDDINWFWIPVWALLITGPGLFVNLNLWTLVAWLTASAVIAACAILSNLKETRYIFTWDRCEWVFGCAVAFVVFVGIVS